MRSLLSITAITLALAATACDRNPVSVDDDDVPQEDEFVEQAPTPSPS